MTTPLLADPAPWTVTPRPAGPEPPDATAWPAAPERPAATEGAGFVSGWADLGAALSAEHADGQQIAFAAAGAGLDTLGVLLHPFDELLQAGFGWLIEHVDFLREPVDALAGDPDDVLAQARSWQHLAGELQAAAAEQQRAATVPGWEGTAAAGYRQAAGELQVALREAAAQAAELSRLVLLTGVAVGTVRALIRDAIAEFLATVVQYLLAAGTLAFLTAGGSLATVVLSIVVRAVELAQDIGRRVQRLLDALVEAGGAAGRIAESMRRSAERLRAAEPGLRAAGEALHGGAGQAHADAVIESGKQLTGATAEYRAWSEQPG
jgi:hypothetical protein